MKAIQASWVREARTALKASESNFFCINPAAYWIDLFVGVTVAYSAAAIYLLAPLFSLAQFLAFPIAVFGLYRIGSLVHEVAHLPQHKMTSFKLVWNLVVGVPTLTPSVFFTKQHRDHHTLRTYGTRQDPEYVINDCEPGSWPSLLSYFVRIVTLPLLVFLRFFLAPLTFLHPKLRHLALSRASSLTLNWKYERSLIGIDRTAFTAVELLCWARATFIPAAVLLGLAPWTRMPQLYLLAASVVLLNYARHLAEHHGQSSGNKLTLADHVLDSCNFTGRNLLILLFFPFGLRFHALHHLFPSLPYHNLSAAHAHLLKQLPADSPYRLLDQPGWWSVASKTFRPHPRQLDRPEKPVPIGVD